MLVVVAVVAAVVVIATYLTWLAGRLDRLHARTDGARASLDAQLVRRAAAAAAVAEYAARRDLLPKRDARALGTAARAASTAGAGEREPAENDLSRALHTAVAGLPGRDGHLSGPDGHLPGPDGHLPDADDDLRPLLDDLAIAASRIVLARRFYNDAVRDTTAVHERRLVRWLRLAGHAPAGSFFEIDDTPPEALAGFPSAQPR